MSKKMKMLLWIDDSRSCLPKEGMVVINCISYDDAINKINKYHEKYELYLDLDTKLPLKKTGYDIALYLVENNIKCCYRVHSLNFKMKKDIEHLLDNYGYLKF